MLLDVYSRRPLDEIGILEGTDKSSLCHSYFDRYDRSFGPVRSLTINVIEIGVANGASTRMWRDYFPNAQIIGVDIQERCRAHAGEPHFELLLRTAQKYPDCANGAGARCAPGHGAAQGGDRRPSEGLGSGLRLRRHE